MAVAFNRFTLSHQNRKEIITKKKVKKNRKSLVLRKEASCQSVGVCGKDIAVP